MSFRKSKLAATMLICLVCKEQQPNVRVLNRHVLSHTKKQMALAMINSATFGKQKRHISGPSSSRMPKKPKIEVTSEIEMACVTPTNVKVSDCKNNNEIVHNYNFRTPSSALTEKHFNRGSSESISTPESPSDDVEKSYFDLEVKPVRKRQIRKLESSDSSDTENSCKRSSPQLREKDIKEDEDSDTKVNDKDVPIDMTVDNAKYISKFKNICSNISVVNVDTDVKKSIKKIVDCSNSAISIVKVGNKVDFSTSIVKLKTADTSKSNLSITNTSDKDISSSKTNQVESSTSTVTPETVQNIFSQSLLKREVNSAKILNKTYSKRDCDSTAKTVTKSLIKREGDPPVRNLLKIFNEREENSTNKTFSKQENDSTIKTLIKSPNAKGDPKTSTKPSLIKREGDPPIRNLTKVLTEREKTPPKTISKLESDSAIKTLVKSSNAEGDPKTSTKPLIKREGDQPIRNLTKVFNALEETPKIGSKQDSAIKTLVKSEGDPKSSTKPLIKLGDRPIRNLTKSFNEREETPPKKISKLESDSVIKTLVKSEGDPKSSTKPLIKRTGDPPIRNLPKVFNEREETPPKKISKLESDSVIKTLVKSEGDPKSSTKPLIKRTGDPPIRNLPKVFNEREETPPKKISKLESDSAIKTLVKSEGDPKSSTKPLIKREGDPMTIKTLTKTFSERKNPDGKMFLKVDSDTDSCPDIGKSSPEPDALYCKVCGNGYTCLDSLERHMQIPNGKCVSKQRELVRKVYVCHLCNKEFSEKNALNVHVNDHLEEDIIRDILDMENDLFPTAEITNEGKRNLYNFYMAGYKHGFQNDFDFCEADVAINFYENLLSYN